MPRMCLASGLYSSRDVQTIFSTAVPIFALIFCGYGAGYFRLLDEASIAGVNRFVFYFALPVLLFDLVATSDFADIVNVRFIVAYLMAGLAVFTAAAVVGGFLFETGRGESALQGLSAVLANTGYMGIPLVVAAFGDEAAIPLVLGITLDVAVLIPLGIILIETGEETAGDRRNVLFSTAAALVRNPLVIGIFTGAFFSATSFGLPEPVANFTGLLGSAAGPCALFALGATLVGRPISGGLGEIGFLSTVKLLVHPAAVWTTTTLLNVNPFFSTVAVLGASLPVAANAFIVARQYNTYVNRTSGAVLVSTIASILTVSTLLAILQP